MPYKFTSVKVHLSDFIYRLNSQTYKKFEGKFFVIKKKLVRSNFYGTIFGRNSVPNLFQIKKRYKNLKNLLFFCDSLFEFLLNKISDQWV